MTSDEAAETRDLEHAMFMILGADWTSVVRTPLVVGGP
jgi:hypothetical protein